MELELRKFDEFKHVEKLDANCVVIDKGSWEARKEVWARNKNTVVILCGTRRWKMTRIEWAKLWKQKTQRNF